MKHFDQDLSADGTTGAPGRAFRLDTNTGLYRPGADRIQVVTGGAARWEVDASGNLFPITDDAADIGDATHRVQDLFLSGAIKSLAAPSSYTPAITASGSNPVLGTSSTAQGYSFAIGKFRIGMAMVQFGSAGTSFGTGNYSISLPSTTDSTFTNTRDVIGTWTARDPSGGTVYSGMCRTTAATVSSALLNVSAGGSVTPTNPYTQANASDIHIQFMYWET